MLNVARASPVSANPCRCCVFPLPTLFNSFPSLISACPIHCQSEPCLVQSIPIPRLSVPCYSQALRSIANPAQIFQSTSAPNRVESLPFHFHAELFHVQSNQLQVSAKLFQVISKLFNAVAVCVHSVPYPIPVGSFLCLFASAHAPRILSKPIHLRSEYCFSPPCPLKSAPTQRIFYLGLGSAFLLRSRAAPVSSAPFLLSAMHFPS